MICAYIWLLLRNTAKRGVLRFQRYDCVICYAFLREFRFWNVFLIIFSHSPYLFLTSLTNFAADHFISILDSLALVRFRSSLVSDLGCELTNFLFVNSAYDNLIAVNFGLQSFRILHLNRMRVTQRQNQFLALFAAL